MNVGIRCTLEPRGIHAQHYLDAVSVLLRDPKQIPTQHELPGHRGMARVVGATPLNIERLDGLAPAPAGDLRVADRPDVFEEDKDAHDGFCRLRRIRPAVPSAALELRARAGKAQCGGPPASWCGLCLAAGLVPW